MLDIVRSMMGFTSLPIFFWRHALEIFCYILNKVSNKSVDKTLYEIWTGRKPVLSHLRIWGCLAYVKCLKIDKLGPKSDRCLFIGYLKKIKRYYFYVATKQKIFVSSWIIFLEREFFGERANACKIELDEVHEVKGLTRIKINLINESNSELIEASLRRSDRVPHQPDKYYDFLV